MPEPTVGGAPVTVQRARDICLFAEKSGLLQSSSGSTCQTARFETSYAVGCAFKESGCEPRCAQSSLHFPVAIETKER